MHACPLLAPSKDKNGLCIQPSQPSWLQHLCMPLSQTLTVNSKEAKIVNEISFNESSLFKHACQTRNHVQVIIIINSVSSDYNSILKASFQTLYPSLLRLMVAHFPHLCLTVDRIKEEEILQGYIIFCTCMHLNIFVSAN